MIVKHMQKGFLITFFLFVLSAFSFDQDMVDHISTTKTPSFRYYETKTAPNCSPNVKGDRLSNSFANLPMSFYYARSFVDLVVGPAADTLVIDEDTHVDGNIFVIGAGRLEIEGPCSVSVAGQIAIIDSAEMLVASAILNFDQFFVGQYSLFIFNDGHFHAENSTISAGGVMHFIQMEQNSTYEIYDCFFPDWTFRKAFDNSSLYLEGITSCGDIMVNDSCNIEYVDCDTIMPWFECPDGSVIDIEFPSPEFVDYFEIHDDVDGIDGIGYRVTVDDCGELWWSLETYPGCSVTVRNSEIRGSCFRFTQPDTNSISGIRNHTLFTDMTVPTSDRYVHYQYTYVFWWNWYSWRNSTLYLSDCQFGECMAIDSGYAHLERCYHDGMTISLTVKDNAFLSCIQCTSAAYTSTFHQATGLYVETYITPLLWYQPFNIAHHNSRLLCVNCDFDSLPFPLDTAEVFWCFIDTMDPVSYGDSAEIIGAAWIETGPVSSVDFDRYSLYLGDSDTSDWHLLATSSDTIRGGKLGAVHSEDFDIGDYILRLTIWNSSGDSLTALRPLVIGDAAISDENPVRYLPRDIFHENPFAGRCRINLPAESAIEIYDISGRMVFEGENSRKVDTHVEFRPKNSGIFLGRLKFDGRSENFRLANLR